MNMATALPPRTRLTLERVLGVTSLSNAMLAVNPVTGEIAFAAGCIVVIYNLRRNKQVRYYRVEKSVASLCFSPSGQFLAIGEKGYLPAITIWDGADGTLCAELQLHKYGVACMAFSRDGAYLVSVGLVHDQQLVAWDLARDATTGQMKGKPVGVATVEDKVLAMDYCHEGNFFVTAGEKHFKYWFLDADNRFLTTGYEVNGLPEIQGRAAVMAAKEDATFTSVGCGFGATKLKTFAVTADGTLCSFGVSCVMERLVSLEAAHGNSLSVSEAYIAVGGSSSVVRLFDPTTLEYKATMPFPPAFGEAAKGAEIAEEGHALQPSQPHRYPAAIAVRLSGSHLVVLYSDRGLFIYDIADLQNPKTDRSFLFHSGSVRDMKIAGRLRGVNGRGKMVYHGFDALHARKTKSDAFIPQGTVVTCGDDNTIRFWHLDLHKQGKASRFGGESATDDDPTNEAWKNPHSQEMLDIIYHDDPHDFLDDEAHVLGGTCSWDDVPDIHTPAKDLGPVNGLRGVAIHPSLNALVAGDKEGSVVLRSLPLAETSSLEIGAYASDIHCLAFGEISTPLGSKCLLAAGGRDRLVHVHDSSKAFASVSKLDNHSGAITGLHFTSDGRKLISCGADKNVVFSEVSADGKINRYNSVPFTGGKIFDIALTSDDEFLLASCNNRLDVLSVSTGKHVRTLHVGEQHRIDVCPANFCAAMSGSLSDKTIHIVDLQSGETLADGTGHGEVITGIKFTPDCRRLISSSSDGCIFIWRLAEELQGAIKARLRKVVEKVVPPPVPPTQVPDKKQEAPAAAALMPPPAPPINAVKKIIPQTGTASNASPAGVQSAPVAESRKAEAKGGRDDAAGDLGKIGGGWKGKAKAVPGPMSNIPHEDWMRTRDSAKKVTSVGDDKPINDATDVQEGVLPIDRSKTPNWAKTFQVSMVQTAPKTSPPKPTEQPRSKWAQRGGGPVDVLRPSQADQPHGSPQDDSSGGLSNLSLASIDVSQSAQTGTSLAIEREQLEKRRKQEETAKAVSEMNDRLSKLGLLKPQKERQVLSPTSATSEASPDVVEGAVVRPPPEVKGQAKLSGKNEDGASMDLGRDGIPSEMFESIDLPIPKVSKQPGEASARRPVLRSSIDLHVDQSMSTFTNGFAVEADPTRASGIGMTNKIAVDQSLSAFSEGYKTNNHTNHPTAYPERKGAPSAVDTSTTFLTRGEVDASLSQFTAGFKSNQDVKQSVDLSAVASSISAFTSGYADNQQGTSPTVNASVDMSSVAASLSNFTTGYVAPSESIPVAESLSSFTSGFAEAAKIIPVRSSLSNVRVDESLSAFTTGYSNPEVADAVSVVPEVAASLSSFTTGYAKNPESPSSSPVSPTPSSDTESATSVAAEKKTLALSAISDLDQQLQLTAQTLKSYAGEGDSNPDIDEIRSLMSQLGLAIQRFASKR